MAEAVSVKGAGLSNGSSGETAVTSRADVGGGGWPSRAASPEDRKPVSPGRQKQKARVVTQSQCLCRAGESRSSQAHAAAMAVIKAICQQAFKRKVNSDWLILSI